MKLSIKTINTLLDPFDIYSIFKDEINSAILDSGSDFSNLGRYSFIGINPFLTLKAKNGLIKYNDVIEKGDIFKKLNYILEEYNIENKTGLPFVAGGIGYISYDIGMEIENISKKAHEDINIPSLYFNFYDNIIIVDNLLKKTYITALGILKDTCSSINEIENKIKNGKKIVYDDADYNINKKIFKSNFIKEEYINTVNKVKEYIRNGDTYVLNLSQRFTCDCKRKPYEVYKDLRHINPAPFSAFMNLDEFAILSSSPERFLKIKDRLVETRPIKGTRPRGKNNKEDELFLKELKNSEKDKSELLMIVDLERNDLSKVCKPHSVKVKEMFKIETYPSVHHLVSTVIGELEDEKSSIDCIKACFPGGSITGAPKIRSMEIINELEKARRNIYTGSIGYIGFDGNIDLNIIIRTILMMEGKASFGVGGGITWESDCAFEYEETLHKAAALMKVLGKEGPI
ncbi:aminodeoxychorismate synthase, subunit I [Clostridium sp. USBA 49]|uniref:aminodeoxychorismate synthase component I n=1 Tax=Clostridium sp. USBA 49 TaxID=1881060 RepID=UPI00099A084B|nr:aminodeoxychorismate synthase component I [Clostridium sp. USBA 49]SKA87596.1 aminodeoxychorismate synthase, subunit I [Clostridium sp. USBA 49]